MIIANFLNSTVGMYMAQAFAHSLIAALIVDRAIQAWKISDPVIRQRFSLIVMIFPVLSFPVYQIINPERGSTSFRLETLFDMNRWLNIELWGITPLSTVFILILAVTTLIFLLQEMIPIVKHTIESRRSASEEQEPYEDADIDRMLEDFPGEKPHVSLIDDEEFILFSTTGKDPVVFLSTGLMKILDADEAHAAVAHEMAHINRSKRPLLVIIYIIRILMFFNPVVLVEFRRMVQEEEKICDDVAVSLTGKPLALAGILKKFSQGRENINIDNMKQLSTLSSTLEDYSHSVHMESRIKRLEDGLITEAGGAWFKFLLTLSAISVTCYFVV